MSSLVDLSWFNLNIYPILSSLIKFLATAKELQVLSCNKKILLQFCDSVLTFCSTLMQWLQFHGRINDESVLTWILPAGSWSCPFGFLNWNWTREKNCGSYRYFWKWGRDFITTSSFFLSHHNFFRLWIGFYWNKQLHALHSLFFVRYYLHPCQQ